MYFNVPVRVTLLLSFLLLLCGVLQAHATNDELFSKGLKSYQTGQYEEAANLFQQSLSEQPTNASVLYNLGLAEYRLGRIGQAVGLWRKALYRDSSLAEAHDALIFANSKLEHKDNARETSYLDVVRNNWPSWLGLQTVLIVLYICTFGLGWRLLSYFGLRRQNRELEINLPAIPLSIFVLSTLVLTLGILCAFRFQDLSQDRGIILPKSIEVRAGPDSGQASLFETYEGLEVIVGDIQNNWVKVRNSGGHSGWVPLEAVALIK